MISSAYISNRLWKPLPPATSQERFKKLKSFSYWLRQLSFKWDMLILVRRNSYFGGKWNEIGSQTPQEPPSMNITQYNRSGCLACFVQSTSSAELSAVGFLATASDQLKIFIIQEPQEAHSPSRSIMIIPSRTTGFPYFRSGRRVIKHSKILQRWRASTFGAWRSRILLQWRATTCCALGRGIQFLKSKESLEFFLN